MSKNSKKKFIEFFLIHELIDQLFPKQCMGCGQIKVDLCPNCHKDLEKGTSFCVACGKKNFLGNSCVGCRKKKIPEKLIVVNKYSGLVKKLIHIAKFEDGYMCLNELSTVLADRIRPEVKPGDIVTCIPLSSSRMRQRGFNQSEIIARIVARELSLEFRILLKRKNRALSQVEIENKKARRENVRGVFELLEKHKKLSNVILIDDVVTTGATLFEAGKVLKKKTAGQVICAALAH